jgi:hypothetical protein
MADAGNKSAPVRAARRVALAATLLVVIVLFIIVSYQILPWLKRGAG